MYSRALPWPRYSCLSEYDEEMRHYQVRHKSVHCTDMAPKTAPIAELFLRVLGIGLENRLCFLPKPSPVFLRKHSFIHFFFCLLTNPSGYAIIPINQLVQLVFKERSTVWHEKRLSGTSQTQLPLWTNALLPGCEDGWVLCCAPGLLRKPLAISCPGVGSPARAFLFSARNKKERGNFYV